MISQSYELRQYLVCYIDILGVREKLFAGINYYDSTVSKEKQEEINQVSIQINRLLKGLNNIDKRMHEIPGKLYDFDNQYAPNLFPKEEFISQIEKTHFSVQQFSDSTLIYAPFNQENEHAIISILCAWNTCLAKWCLTCMSQGIMFRGAMTIGTAWELRPHCLFGPAVHEVYRLESETAKHPRIVISRRLKGFIEKCLETNRKTGIDINHIPTPLHMIHTDDDGIDMLHYLSKVIKIYAEAYGNLHDIKKQISTSFDNLSHEYEIHFQNANTNPKSAELAQRYLMVINYFMKHNVDWDNCIDNCSIIPFSPFVPSHCARKSILFPS